MANYEKRISKKGEISYRATVRLKGHRRESATFSRKTDAKRWAQKMEADIREGRYFPGSEAKKKTVSDMLERYRRDVLPYKKESTASSQAIHMDWWENEIGEFTLGRITPALISEYRDRLLSEPNTRNKKRSNATVVRYMATLSHVFSVAVRDWEWLEDNPCRKVTKPKEPRGIVRFLSDEERVSLLKACRNSHNEDLYCAVVIAISTGCRRGELRSLKWSHVDLERGLLIFEETKNGERRNAPLVGHALDEMKARAERKKKEDEKKRREERGDDNLHNLSDARKVAEEKKSKDEYVFPGRIPGKPVDFTRAWRKARHEAGVENFRWHDLRHTCASYLSMEGATPVEVAEVLGHKSLEMVKRYSHLSEAHTSRLVSSMTNKIFGKAGDNEEEPETGRTMGE